MVGTVQTSFMLADSFLFCSLKVAEWSELDCRPVENWPILRTSPLTLSQLGRSSESESINWNIQRGLWINLGNINSLQLISKLAEAEVSETCFLFLVFNWLDDLVVKTPLPCNGIFELLYTDWYCDGGCASATNLVRLV